MGMKISSTDEPTSSYNSSSNSVLSEINVTPFVDVMLVLLIIFMVSAPMMQQGVHVDLPQNEAPTLDAMEESLILSIDSEMNIFVGESQISYQSLAPQVAGLMQNREKREIYVHADRSIPYGFVANVIAGLKNAGIERVGLVTEPPES